MKERKK